MLPTLPVWRCQTTCLTISARPSSSFRNLFRLTDESTATDDPAPSLQFYYRTFITTTSRSAGAPRDGTQSLTVSAAWDTPSHHPNQGDSFGARLPTFRARAADRTHVAYMPDTA